MTVWSFNFFTYIATLACWVQVKLKFFKQPQFIVSLHTHFIDLWKTEMKSFLLSSGKWTSFSQNTQCGQHHICLCSTWPRNLSSLASFLISVFPYWHSKTVSVASLLGRPISNFLDTTSITKPTPTSIPTSNINVRHMPYKYGKHKQTLTMMRYLWNTTTPYAWGHDPHSLVAIQ